MNAKTHSAQGFSIFLLLLGGVLSYGFLLSTAAPSVALVGVLAACIFVASILKIEFALGLLLMGMLLSPEIPLGRVGLQTIMVRIEDLLIPLIALVWLARAAILGDRRLWAPSKINAPILLLVAINLIASARAIVSQELSTGSSLFMNLKFIEFFSLFFFANAYFHTERQAKMAFGLVLITGLLVLLYTVPMIPKTEIYTPNRLSAPFEGKPEPGTLGGYLCLLLAFLLAFFFNFKEAHQKLLTGVAILGVTLVILFTLSRTSYGTLLATLAIVAIVARKPWMFVGLLLILLFSPILLPHQAFDRIISTFDPTSPLGLEAAARERLEVWPKAFYCLRQRPFLGMGVGATGVVDSQYARILIETGILGFAAFTWLHGRILFLAFGFHKRAKTPFLKSISMGYLCGHIALLIHALGAITFSIIRIMEPFWFLTGLLVAMERLDRSTREEDQDFG